MRLIIIVGCALALSGCAARLQELSQQECLNIGLQLGTPEFDNCYQAAMQRRYNMIQTGLQMMARPQGQP